MILVERGNLLPTVAVVQYLLNHVLGSSLRIDGDFGARTKQAVKDFQSKKRIPQDGTVGPQTWRLLSAGRGLQVVDHVDAADDYHSAPGYRGYEQDLLRTGASPIVSYLESGGIEGVARLIRQAVRTNGSVVLLRFHGHGGPGAMALTRGRGGMEHEHADSISLFTLDWAQIARHFGPLHRIFSPLGSAELHGCSIAGEIYHHGRRVQNQGVGVGPYLLRRLSQLWGVPVTASPNPQYSHGRAILRFEGRTITSCPDGHQSIAAWARGKAL